MNDYAIVNAVTGAALLLAGGVVLYQIASEVAGLLLRALDRHLDEVFLGGPGSVLDDRHDLIDVGRWRPMSVAERASSKPGRASGSWTWV